MQQNIKYITEDRVQLVYNLPLSEMVFDFYDKLKSISKGYASLDYEFKGYVASDLAKLEILLNDFFFVAKTGILQLFFGLPTTKRTKGFSLTKINKY